MGILDETTCGLSAAAKSLPRLNRDRPVAISTLVRWVTKGVRGPGGSRVRLEAVRLGGRWITSAEAIARFVSALSDKPSEAAGPLRTPGQRRRSSERAEAALVSLGI